MIQRRLLNTAAWLASSSHSGKFGEAVYPYWAGLLEQLFDRDAPPPLTTVDGAIGTGKTMFCQLAGLRVLYEILEAGGAQTYGLGANEFLHVVLCGKGAVGRLSSAIHHAHYFCHREKERSGTPVTDTIEFPAERVRVIAGRPDDSALLGLNCAAVISDSTNDPSVDTAKTCTVSRALWRRMSSRSAKSKLPGLLLYAGAGSGTTDALKGAIHKRLAIWEVEEYAEDRKMFRVALHPGKKPYIVKKNDPVPIADGVNVLLVPEDYRREFEEDTAGALRDLAGVPCGQ